VTAVENKSRSEAEWLEWLDARWPEDNRSEDEWREDEALVNALMSGVVHTRKINKRGGMRVTKYLTRGEQRPAREAMARLLRSGRSFTLTQDFRNRLAEWFDDGRGRGRDQIRNTYINTFIYRCIRRGASLPKAQEKAANRFALSHEAIKTIWGKGKNRFDKFIEKIDRLPLVEEIDGPLE
jgi:hypothetical protein